MELEQINAALQPIRAAYYTEVREIAKEALKIEDDDARQEYVDEQVDGSRWVFITYQARLVAVVSDNWDAAEDLTGEVPETVEARAYWAMCQDVNELLTNEYFIAEQKGA